MRRCTVAECDDPHHARDLCNKHYSKFRLYGDPLVSMRRVQTPQCIVKGCAEKPKGLDLCKRHYQQQREKKRLPRDRRALPQPIKDPNELDRLRRMVGIK
jgi:hypothetical protein